MEDTTSITSSSKSSDAARDLPTPTTTPSEFDPRNLPELEKTAATATVADNFDIATEAKAAADVDPEESAALKRELQGCGRDLRSSKRQETRSRENNHRALARIFLIGTTALHEPQALIALARKKKVPMTKASWKSPYLILLRLIDPTMDDKSASMCARALNYVAAAGVPADNVAAFIAKHGVVALAGEEAKRQKLRKGGNAEKPPAEDPLEVLRQESTATMLPPALELKGMPTNGQAALMVFERDPEGRLLAWAVDADEKAVAAAARRILKIRKAAKASEEEK